MIIVFIYFCLTTHRQGQEAPQRVLFQKVKFASFLVDNFVPYDTPENNNQLPDKKSSEFKIRVIFWTKIVLYYNQRI